MRTRRLLVLLTALLTTLLAVVSCAKDSGTAGSSSGNCKLNDAPTGTPPAASTVPAPAPGSASALKVGVAFDIGGRGDTSFNDAAGAGIDKAKKDLGVTDTKELTASPNESTADATTRLRQLVAGGYNPIIAVGFKYADALKVAAAETPNVKFAIVDGVVDGATNVTPLVFTEEQGSFLVGAAAAYKTKACHIGFIGGVETPLIKKFEAGYIQGAKAVAPDIKIDSKYLTPAGDFTGFNDPAKGAVATKGELDNGADVIYHAAGGSGPGVFQSVKTASTKDNPKWAIGVDSDQYNQPNLAAVKDIILTSMLKRVDVAVFDYISAVAGNNLAALPKAFDLKVDGVGYATSGGFVDDIKAKLDGYKAQIIGGQVTVKTTP
ncbi:MAG: Basic rane lipoprotein [Pseudonocardia sp.]|nr:Basic rane lipoprotein [Pseudonocardia sp.]